MRIGGISIVNELHARSRSENLASLLKRDVAFKFKRDAFGMRTKNGHTNTGAIHAQLGKMHDFAALVLKLHLFRSEALVFKATNLRNEVARKLGSECVRLRHGFALAHRRNLRLELVHARHACAARGLIGAHNHTLHARGLMKRPRRNKADNGGAIRVRNNALIPFHIFAIDFRHNQGHIFIHAEGVRIIDDRCARLHGMRKQFLGDVIASGAQDDIATLEALRGGFFNDDFFALEFNRFASTACTREKPQTSDREIALLQALEHLLAHSARSTQNSDVVATHWSPPLRLPRQ